MQGFYNGKMDMVMTNEFDWEKKGKTGACRSSGQFIKNGEDFCLVIVLGEEFRKAYPKEGNFIIKKEIFDELLKKHGDDGDAAVIELFSKKQPVAKNRTPIDEEMTEKMKEILHRKKLYIYKETKDKLRFKYSRTDSSAGYVFCKRSFSLENISRRNKGLFGDMMESQFMSQLREELLGLPEGFRVQKTLDKAKETVNQIMGSGGRS